MRFRPCSRFFGFAAMLAALSFLLSWREPQTQGQDTKPKAPPLTAEQTEKVKERDQLISQIDKLGRQGKLNEIVPLFEKVIALEKGIYGEAHPRLAMAEASLARLHLQREDFPSARAASAASLATFTKSLGKNHWRVTDARWALHDVELLAKSTPAERAHFVLAGRLNRKGMHFHSRGKYVEAKDFSERALAIRTRLLGDAHPATAYSYQNLGADLRELRQYAEAEKMLRKALAIMRKLLGEQHPNTANSYGTLALALREQGQYAEAERLHRKSLEINRKVFGEEHPTTATSYARLAEILRDQGQYAEATSLDSKALAINRKVLGEEHPVTATSYGLVAADLRGQGQYAEAEKLDRKALVILRKALGEDHPNTARAYSSLAADLTELAQYAEAERLNRKALAIRRTSLGEKHPDTATSYHNLGDDLSNQGQQAEAERLHRKALKIKREFFGDEHPSTGNSYNKLATQLRRQGHYAEAVRLHRKALVIVLRIHGEKHPHTAASYNNLARDLCEQGQFAEAEELDRKALEIIRNASGEDHPNTATTYANLADDLRLQGQYAEAEKLNRKALKIRRKVLGEHHLDTAASYGNLAAESYLKGDYAKAEEGALAVAKSFQAARLRASFSGLGRSTFGAELSPAFFLTGLLARNGRAARAWKSFEADRGRGLFDDLNARYSRGQRLSARERQEEEHVQTELARIEKQLSDVLGDKKTTPKVIEELRNHRDQLMLDLVEHQSKMEQKYGAAAGQVYGLEKIQAQLTTDTALVGWADLYVPVRAKDPNGEHWGIVVRYKGPPTWVKLEASHEGKWQDHDNRRPANALKSLLDPTSEPASHLNALYRQRLQPLEKHLQGVKHLVVLPSRDIAVVPIEALTDHYRVSYSPSGTIYAWLQEQRKNVTEGSENLLALGDPAFSADQAKVVVAQKDDPVGRLIRGTAPTPLPGSRREVEGIARLFADRKGRVKKLLGPDANGVNLAFLAQKDKAAPFRYLHLATHAEADWKGGMNSFLKLTSNDFALASFDKLSAGQIMRTWKLDADLVTLSACETALGEHRGGEGFVGFSQALFFAGARTLVLSQWKVDDKATTLLMHRFYENLLGSRPEQKAPLSKLEALTEAKRWLKGLEADEAARRLRDLKVEVSADWERKQPDHPFAHPYFWAAFILVGDPGKAEAKAK